MKGVRWEQGKRFGRGGRRGRNFAKGFSLIEWIMVMVLLSIVAVSASPRLANLPTTRAQFAIRKMQSDVRYAQLLAMESQRRTRILFDVAKDQYQLEIETSAAVWVPVLHPSTQTNFTVTLNAGDFAGVDVTSVTLDGNSEVIFDAYGAPYNAAGSPLTEPAYVELNSKYQLHFREQTGKVDIVTL